MLTHTLGGRRDWLPGWVSCLFGADRWVVGLGATLSIWSFGSSKVSHFPNVSQRYVGSSCIVSLLVWQGLAHAVEVEAVFGLRVLESLSGLPAPQLLLLS